MNRKDVEEKYESRIESFEQQVARLQKTENRLVILRLLVFIAAIGLFYTFLGTSLIVAFILLFLGLAVLGYVMNYNLRISRQRQQKQHLQEINEKELRCVNGDYQSFPDGEEHINKEHPYASDLDIFGKASLFQYLNRTTSKPGSQMLAGWLKAPAKLEEIARRQAAIEELKNFTDWRQNLLAVGYRHSESSSDPATIVNWANQKSYFLSQKYLVPVTSLLSLAVFAVIGFLFLGLPVAWLIVVILVNLSVAGLYTKKVNQIHREVTQTVGLLQAYTDTIHLIESEPFRSPKLTDLQQLFKGREHGASKQLSTLSGLVNKLDYRLNLVVGVILNILFFWDIRQSIKLEAWKQHNREYIGQWFEAMAEFEALSSLATAGFNNPGWVMPVIASTHFTLQAVEAGHPLIPEGRRVSNSLVVDGTGKIVLVTGSNMSGKSTFLRTCGVNMVLAMSGAPVCASRFEMSPVTVFTSMRIADSLDENTSSFYAELKRLASIIKSVENNEKVFLLLDEILRGTNSNDRHIGSVALIRQFIVNKAVGIVATHDLELSGLVNEFPQGVENYNFDVKIENDELYFDYRLNNGICRSLNASILMKKMGIHIS